MVFPSVFAHIYRDLQVSLGLNTEKPIELTAVRST
jgi:hypothetical protein